MLGNHHAQPLGVFQIVRVFWRIVFGKAQVQQTDGISLGDQWRAQVAGRQRRFQVCAVESFAELSTRWSRPCRSAQHSLTASSASAGGDSPRQPRFYRLIRFMHQVECAGADRHQLLA